MKVYFVYMLANCKNGTLYTGVTNNLLRRVIEHKKGLIKGFTKKYNVTMLVYYNKQMTFELLFKEKAVKKVEQKMKN